MYDKISASRLSDAHNITFTNEMALSASKARDRIYAPIQWCCSLILQTPMVIFLKQNRQECCFQYSIC